MRTERGRTNASPPHMKSLRLEPEEEGEGRGGATGVIKFPLNDKILFIQHVCWLFAWYLARTGHLWEEGGAAAGQYVFHLNRLRLHRLSDVNLVALGEKPIRCQSRLSPSLFLGSFL